MNIKAIVIATAAVALSSTAISAQNRDKTNCPKACAAKQQCADTACTAQRAFPNPFEGINLTAEQQTKLSQLRPAAKPSREQKQQARQDARKEYLAKVKTILTPEQYTQFLENSFVNSGKIRKDGDRKQGKMGKPGKMSKQGKRDMRPAGKPDRK